MTFDLIVNRTLCETPRPTPPPAPAGTETRGRGWLLVACLCVCMCACALGFVRTHMHTCIRVRVSTTSRYSTVLKLALQYMVFAAVAAGVLPNEISIDGLGELLEQNGRPKWRFSTSVNWDSGPVSVGMFGNYVGHVYYMYTLIFCLGCLRFRWVGGRWGVHHSTSVSIDTWCVHYKCFNCRFNYF